METNIDLNTFAILDCSRFKTTEWFKARIAVLVLRDRTSDSSSFLPSIVKAISKYFNFSTCFNDALTTRRDYWTRFPERFCSSVLEVLTFIPAMSHAAAKPFNACCRPDSEEASKTKLSAKTNRLILHLPIVTL